MNQWKRMKGKGKEKAEEKTTALLGKGKEKAEEKAEEKTIALPRKGKEKAEEKAEEKTTALPGKAVEGHHEVTNLVQRRLPVARPLGTSARKGPGAVGGSLPPALEQRFQVLKHTSDPRVIVTNYHCSIDSASCSSSKKVRWANFTGQALTHTIYFLPGGRLGSFTPSSSHPIMVPQPDCYPKPDCNPRKEHPVASPLKKTFKEVLLTPTPPSQLRTNHFPPLLAHFPRSSEGSPSKAGIFDA